MKPYIYSSNSETARALILHLVKMLLDHPEKTYHLAVSGGSTPALMFDLWANDYREITPWNRLKVYWVDERCVPPENSDSNYGLMRGLLFGHVPIPYENVFRIRGEDNPMKEAVRYSQLVKTQVPMHEGWPVFDIILLGAGSDGHTSSIFPGQERMLTSDHLYEPSMNPNNGQRRVALTGIPMVNARKVIFLITGKDKASVVEEMFLSGDTCPAAYVAHHAQHVDIFMDDSAATRICTRLKLRRE